MIGPDEADKLAKVHTARMPEPAPGYRFCHSKCVKVEPGWYYDYQIICDRDIPTSEQEQFAGAFGFLVKEETGEIEEISHGKWVDLGLAFHEKPYG